MPNGDVIKQGVKFIDIRSKYKDDPWYEGLKRQAETGTPFEYTLHRFWHQVDYAVALGLAHIFGYTPDTVPGPNPDPGDEVKLGDINFDGEINSIDYALLKSALLGRTKLSAEAEKAADLDKNGEVNSIDYALLKSYLLGKIKDFNR